jgi:hypothetical protein
MATIVTRAGKGSALTHNEVDANFNNLNNDKYEAGDSATLGASSISANTTTDALRITQTGTGNAFVVEDSESPDATPFVIDADGRVLNGTTTAITTRLGTTNIVPSYQQPGTGLGGATAAFFRYSSSSAANTGILFNKSNSNTVGTHSLIGSENNIGQIAFNGSDGNNFIPGVTIQATTDGTPGTNDMPGRLVFSTTPSGSDSPVERMRIDSAGNVGIGTTTPSSALTVDGTITGTAIKPVNDTLFPDLGLLVPVGMDTSLIYKGRILSGDDLNTIYEPGIYRINSSSDASGIANTPAQAAGAVLEVISPDSIRSRGARSLIIQRYTQRSGSGRTWTRTSLSTTVESFSEWRERYSQGNIIGTVSQSSGVPTGAIIEQGSNANGEFVKFADGTMTCRFTIAMGSITAFGTGTFIDPYRTAAVTAPFPADFIALGDASVAVNGHSINESTASRRWATVSVRSRVTNEIRDVQVIRIGDNNHASTTIVQVVVSGRWY